MRKKLSKSLKKTARSLSADSLAKFPLKVDETALLVIDVQKRYCFMGDARRTAKRIAKLVPAFRKAGVDVYVIYMSNKGPQKAKDIDFREFRAEKSDSLVDKKTPSAFDSSNIKDILRKDGKKSILACGFYLGACVKQTLFDARTNRFSVCLLRDMAHNAPYSTKEHDETDIREMKKRKIAVAHSGDVLKKLEAGRKR